MVVVPHKPRLLNAHPLNHEPHDDQAYRRPASKDRAINARIPDGPTQRRTEEGGARGGAPEEDREGHLAAPGQDVHGNLRRTRSETPPLGAPKSPQYP
uniref:Uncharacterized protein n=1 Tax=Steinernema glaseri TaxID=37863 RepID=A0A1I7ZP03_9BILA